MSDFVCLPSRRAGKTAAALSARDRALGERGRGVPVWIEGADPIVVVGYMQPFAHRLQRWQVWTITINDCAFDPLDPFGGMVDGDKITATQVHLTWDRVAYCHVSPCGHRHERVEGWRVSDGAFEHLFDHPDFDPA